MVINPNGNPRILVVDCGLKHNQLRCLKGKKIMALTLTLKHVHAIWSSKERGYKEPELKFEQF